MLDAFQFRSENYDQIKFCQFPSPNGHSLCFYTWRQRRGHSLQLSLTWDKIIPPTRSPEHTLFCLLKGKAETWIIWAKIFKQKRGFNCLMIPLPLDGLSPFGAFCPASHSLFAFIHEGLQTIWPRHWESFAVTDSKKRHSVSPASLFLLNMSIREHMLSIKITFAPFSKKHTKKQRRDKFTLRLSRGTRYSC